MSKSDFKAAMGHIENQHNETLAELNQCRMQLDASRAEVGRLTRELATAQSNQDYTCAACGKAKNPERGPGGMMHCGDCYAKASSPPAPHGVRMWVLAAPLGGYPSGEPWRIWDGEQMWSCDDDWSEAAKVDEIPEVAGSRGGIKPDELRELTPAEVKDILAAHPLPGTVATPSPSSLDEAVKAWSDARRVWQYCKDKYSLEAALAFDGMVSASRRVAELAKGQKGGGK